MFLRSRFVATPAFAMSPDEAAAAAPSAVPAAAAPSAPPPTAAPPTASPSAAPGAPSAPRRACGRAGRSRYACGRRAARRHAHRGAGQFPGKLARSDGGRRQGFPHRLDRFDSPAAVAKSYRELEAKVSSGELKAPVKPPAADAKPEEVAAWRKEQGLPETAQAYVEGLKLPNGTSPARLISRCSALSPMRR